MSAFIVYLCSGLCMLVYIPAVLVGVKDIITRRATFDTRRFKRFQFTGVSAIIFGIGQTIGGLIAMLGVVQAVQNFNLLYIPLYVLFGGGFSLLGLWLARKTAQGEYELDMTPKIDISGIRINLVNFPSVQMSHNEPDDMVTISPDDVTTLEDRDDMPDEAPPKD